MKFRSKLLLAFVGIAVLSVVLGLGIVYIFTKKLLFNELRSKTLSIAMTAASEIDADLFKGLDTPKAIDTQQYLEAKKVLKSLRDANRREDIFVVFVYTYSVDPQNPEKLVFNVDAEEDPGEASPPGQVVEGSDEKQMEEYLKKPYVDKGISKDAWGHWLSAFAPIYDSQGNFVAMLGVDLSAQDIELEMMQLVIYGLIALGASILLALIVGFIFSHTASKSLASLCDVVREIGKGHLECKADLNTHDEFSDLGDAINEMTKGLEERERLKTNFARYVSAQVLEKIMKGGSLGQLEGERRRITVLFSDIRDFTRLAEEMPPEKVVLFLNEYFDKMIDVIFKYYGTLDKFLGDGIMIEFGAPLDDEKQEQHALLAATGMIEAIAELNNKWKAEGKPTIRVGMGVNTGFAVVGNIGSMKRVEYTAIGDTVNIAENLEEATKSLQETILLSQATYEAVKDLFPFRYLGEISIEGRHEPIRVYTIDTHESRRKTEK